MNLKIKYFFLKYKNKNLTEKKIMNTTAEENDNKNKSNESSSERINAAQNQTSLE